MREFDLDRIPYTPAIVIDETILDANIAAMADFAAANHLTLRPHAKTHKIAAIAHKQLAAGSPGLAVATLGEAQYFIAAGVTDLFIAYPVWATADDAELLARLATDGTLAVGTDSVEAVHCLADITGEHPGIEWMIELNSGHHRSGVFSDQVVPIAQTIAQRNMTLRGVFTFPGHSYAPGEHDTAAADEAETLHAAQHELAAAGFDVAVRSGGSSPTATATVANAATEIRPGVYVFGDTQQLELGRIDYDDIALTVVTTVVSRHDAHADAPARIIIDAGSKILATDRAPWATGHGRVLGHPDARITAVSEHHGTIIWDDGELPAIGTRLRVIPNHVCVAVNLVDEVFVIDGEQRVSTWQVGARGMNT
ncbi:alanine racemase [Enteractinococcus coprophilus]|uniref:D-serine deaminase-like pyridoxal phosphate-dependent protein n=1 Tax=Enteractinococcus coprophilus TaxID=1027633 RepID=A0A543AN88_9MICC|nr:alanine racemase [Enteractinococcus coprophilus]TQL74051.1 D-serine deaminase-like pyridoxal phosphate-dependent protein [Enteractinococcus coprophilus]